MSKTTIQRKRRSTGNAFDLSLPRQTDIGVRLGNRGMPKLRAKKAAEAILAERWSSEYSKPGRV